jgi:hypothetical protein
MVGGGAVYIILEGLANIIYFDQWSKPDRGSWR